MGSVEIGAVGFEDEGGLCAMVDDPAKAARQRVERLLLIVTKLEHSSVSCGKMRTGITCLRQNSPVAADCYPAATWKFMVLASAMRLEASRTSRATRFPSAS